MFFAVFAPLRFDMKKRVKETRVGEYTVRELKICWAFLL